MKDISELNPHGYETSEVIDRHLRMTFERVMELQGAYLEEHPDEPGFQINSGLRSDEHQQRLIAAGKTNAVHSKHLAGLAVDINDPEGKIGKWALENAGVLARIGLWAEHPKHTKNWLHVQSSPPKSGKRFFIP